MLLTSKLHPSHKGNYCNKTYFNEELADILTLISLKLDHFTILWVLNHCPIAGKLLLSSRIVSGQKGQKQECLLMKMCIKCIQN